MVKLKNTELHSIELSIDEVNDIYFYKDKVLRAIKDEYVEQTKEMFRRGVIKELVGKNLIPNLWISNYEIDGYSLVLEQEYIQNWNYPYEWSFDMLKDAALTVIKVNKILNKHGYQIRDGHSFNVVFNMGVPQYIDLGSFFRTEKQGEIFWSGYSIFYSHFYIPLFLWSKGYVDIARNIFLMRNYFNEYEFFKIKHPILNLFFGKSFFNVYKKIRTVSLVSSSKIKQNLNNSLKKNTALVLKQLFQSHFTYSSLEKSINNFFKPKEKSVWSNYHDNIDASTYKRFIRIREIINSMKDAESVIELASNQGKFAESILKYTHIKKVIATDYDKEALNIMYLNNKNRDDFLPLLFDFVRTEGRICDKNIEERIKSDIVIALALTHHLILTQNTPVEYIFTKIQKLTNKYVIVEFMPLGLYGGDLNNIPKVPEFYNLDWFRENFVKYFDLILDEKLEINRHVFVGKLKNEN